MNNKGKEVVLVISDTQEPFAHPDTIAFLRWVKAKYKPTKVVHVGDEMDFAAISNYDHDPDGMSAGLEYERGIEKMQDYYKLFPNVQVCTSNHTARPLRKAFGAGIPKAFLKDYHEFMQAPKGWKWAYQHVIDGVVYEHGEGFSGYKGALNCAEKNGASTVIGHLHSHAGILYSANAKDIIYGFNVGCLIDKDAYAFAYGKSMRHKPLLGVGIVDKGVPMWVPMLLSKSGRWVKK